MIITQIETWIKTGKNFNAGCLIYQEIHGNNFFFKLLSKGANAYTIEQLTVRLKNDLDSATNKRTGTEIITKKPSKKSSTKPAPAKNDIYIQSDYPDLPDELKTQADQLKDLWPQLNAKRHSLLHLETDDQRLAAARIIVRELEPSIDHIYEALDHWKIHGEILEVSGPTYQSPVIQLKSWQKEYKQLGEYLSRNKNHESEAIQAKLKLKLSRRIILKKLINA